MSRPRTSPDGLLIVLTGPSGTGKSTLLKECFAADPRLALSISHTTRPPRAAERDGVDYWFVDDPTFDRMTEAGEFAEWARVHTRRYGTSRGEIARLVAAGRDPVFDIDVVGANNLAAAYPDCIRVFLLPPSLAILEQRLRGRGTESEAMIATRLTNAKAEIVHARDYDYMVINTSVSEAARALGAIIEAERHRARRLPDLPAQLLADKEIS